MMSAMQRTMGNARLSRMGGTTGQAKLTVGAPNDSYAQEADRVATQVVSQNTSSTQRGMQRQGEAVVQQNGDGFHRKMTLSQPGETHEVEADRRARAVKQQEQRRVTPNADQKLLSRQEEERQAPTSPGRSEPIHYRFEIKAWIPFAHVPDPEEVLHEVAFRLAHSESVDQYTSEYRGDGHSGYPGGYRVLHVVEFDWDGTRMMNVMFPAIAHFGTSHRDFSAVLRNTFSFPQQSRFVHAVDSATTDHTVTGGTVGAQEVDLGMSSPNPLTIAPAPDIDADYTLFISQDTFGIETVTVRWTTDFMPNHGFSVIRNGVVVREKVVNALPGPISAPEIFIRLNSKSNGGADTFEP
jgi:hypothetical protein